jgi:hypothetical protein
MIRWLKRLLGVTYLEEKISEICRDLASQYQILSSRGELVEEHESAIDRLESRIDVIQQLVMRDSAIQRLEDRLTALDGELRSKRRGQPQVAGPSWDRLRTESAFTDAFQRKAELDRGCAEPKWWWAADGERVWVSVDGGVMWMPEDDMDPALSCTLGALSDGFECTDPGTWEDRTSPEPVEVGKTRRIGDVIDPADKTPRDDRDPVKPPLADQGPLKVEGAEDSPHVTARLDEIRDATVRLFVGCDSLEEVEARRDELLQGEFSNPELEAISKRSAELADQYRIRGSLVSPE